MFEFMIRISFLLLYVLICLAIYMLLLMYTIYTKYEIQFPSAFIIIAILGSKYFVWDYVNYLKKKSKIKVLIDTIRENTIYIFVHKDIYPMLKNDIVQEIKEKYDFIGIDQERYVYKLKNSDK